MVAEPITRTEDATRLDQQVLDTALTFFLRNDIPQLLDDAQRLAVTRYIARGRTENRFIHKLRADQARGFSPAQLRTAAMIMVEEFTAYMRTRNLEPQFQQDGSIAMVPAPPPAVLDLTHIGAPEPINAKRPMNISAGIPLPSLESGMMGTYTFEGPVDHVTFRVKPVHTEKGPDGKRLPSTRTYRGLPMIGFVERLTGPDNYADYQGRGSVCETPEGIVAFLWAKGDQDTHLRQALQALGTGGAVLQSRLCCVCGRKLTRPSSIHAGMGADCASKS